MRPLVVESERDNAIERLAVEASEARANECRVIAIYEAIHLLQAALQKEPGLESAIHKVGLNRLYIDPIRVATGGWSDVEIPTGRPDPSERNGYVDDADNPNAAMIEAIS